MTTFIKTVFSLMAAAALVLLSGIDARAQIGGVPLWTNFYNEAGTEVVEDLAVDRAGNIFVTGSSGVIGFQDFATVKYSGTGMPLWTNRYRGPGSGYYLPRAIAVDSNGNAIVTGFSKGNGCATIKYSGGGVPLWTNHLNASSTKDIAVDANGNIFVTGGDGDFITVAYSNAGAPLWTNRYHGPGIGNDGAKAIAVDGSGNAIVTGASTGISGSAGIATIKYAGGGVPLWTNRYESVYYSSASAVVADGSGNVFISGGGGYGYCTLIKYSGAGAPLWTNVFPSIGGGVLAVDSSGNLYVAATSPSIVSTNYDFLTRKYSGSGVALWSNRFNGPDDVDDYVFSLALDGSGNVFVHGQSIYSEAGEGYFLNFMTLGYSNGGVPLWTNVYANGWFTAAKAVAVDANGNVVVAGDTLAFTSTDDFVIIKYSSAILPRLAISRTNGNAVAVSWPSPSYGFNLQENTNVHQAFNWMNVSTPVQDDGLRKTLIANPAAGNRFYRLFYKP
ncbi:MAG TPA: hypothetical protein VN673_14675 [Clostridia bacterium]|nr:hypothetical protein [Clostridia bacterium]